MDARGRLTEAGEAMEEMHVVLEARRHTNFGYRSYLLWLYLLCMSSSRRGAILTYFGYTDLLWLY